jgi:Putative prokaryotic signal transducing protein
VIEVFRTNDQIELNFAENVLRQAGLEPIVLDGETAGVYAGALPFIKRRIMVIDEEAHLARTALKTAFDELPGD